MLISDSYRKLNKALHASNRHYGASGSQWRDDVMAMIGPGTVLDYGCGKNPLSIEGARLYDPAINGISDPPEPADYVICTDVLEHVEPEFIDNVIADLRRVTIRALFLAVCTKPAEKFLADGRNAHLIQENASWWGQKVEKHFKIDPKNTKTHFISVCT